MCCSGTNYAVERGTANNTILGVENLIDLLTMPLLLLLLKNTYFLVIFMNIWRKLVNMYVYEQAVSISATLDNNYG